jgi:hypothetical protein
MWVAEQELLNRTQEASPGARPHQKTPRRTEKNRNTNGKNRERTTTGQGSASQEEHATSGAPAHGDERGACLKRAWPRNPGDEEIDTEEISKKKEKKWLGTGLRADCSEHGQTRLPRIGKTAGDGGVLAEEADPRWKSELVDAHRCSWEQIEPNSGQAVGKWYVGKLISWRSVE